MIKTLDDKQKESCEGLLTVKEFKEALKNSSKNKSPSFFRDLLSDTMVNSFNYNLVSWVSPLPAHWSEREEGLHGAGGGETLGTRLL